ncbi:hypothetical protein B0H16DRAFT_1465305 [Mycena metata]|uniref:Uncharacterized protein n=1 Tax=Mycena metata TaxID=1033252 RepID=A0AAD7IBG1_9AGAR|nr:hypothetical protein B0H16DRAFT_1465305 [Mycena metata]
MSTPEALEDNTAADDAPAQTWDDFAQAWANAILRPPTPPAQSSIPDDLIPDGPAHSWDDLSWQQGQAGHTDGERVEAAWANLAPMSAGNRGMGPGTRLNVLENHYASYHRPLVPTVEITVDVATECSAEADAIERNSTLLHNLFWDPLAMPAHFRESVQRQLARMEPRKRARAQRILGGKRRKMHIFDEEREREEDARPCRACPEPGSTLKDVPWGEEELA